MSILNLDEFVLEEEKSDNKNLIVTWLRFYFGTQKKVGSKLKSYYGLMVSMAKLESKKEQAVIKRSDPRDIEVLNNEIDDVKKSLMSIEQELVYDINNAKLPNNYKDKLKSFKDKEIIKARMAYRKLKVSFSKATRSKREIANSEKIIKNQQQEAAKKEASIKDFEKKMIDKAKEEQKNK